MDREFLKERYIESGRTNWTFYDELLEQAKMAREYAIPKRSKLSVGVAVLGPLALYNAHKKDSDGVVWPSFFRGGNVETLWQNSYHAEANAIMNAIAHGAHSIIAVCVAAERELFTPCGGCMDLIFEFGGEDCKVFHYNPATKKVQEFKAKELMPFYPTRK